MVAYFQPVTRAYVEQVRGVDSSYSISMLAERGLIEECGRLEVPGRPAVFRTTDVFLRTMGISRLSELPPLPEMSAPEVSEKLDAAITSGKYDVIIINFANPDMVGHTGVLEAAIKAVERVDQCVGAAVDAVKQMDGVLFVCADHGNAEQMINYETGEPHTAHTTNQVPFILYNYDPAYTLREGGRLCDIAPTLLEVMGLPQPAEMTGQSLLIKK